MCTVNFVTQTIAATGITAYPFDKVDELVAKIQSLANQDLTDYVGEPGETIYAASGAVLLALTATIVVGTPPTVGTLSVGVSMSKAKALDFASGLQQFILDVI